MAEQNPIAISERRPAPDTYRPLSGLAVAAFIVAVIYAILMGIVAAVALTKGIPLFMALWTLLLPIGGAFLAFLARRQIRSAEGTRGGDKLAAWAWWLCVTFGLGYLAYYAGTRFAVTWQAKDFSQKWVQKLRDGKVTHAFMDTLPYLQRKNQDPSNRLTLERYEVGLGRRKGLLPMFRELDFVRAFEEWGDQAEVTHVGVKGWDYDTGAYIVTQTYRVKTPEGEYSFDVAVKSNEGPEIEGRQWQVVKEALLARTPPKRAETGEILDQWRQGAKTFAGEWLRKRFFGDTFGAYVDTIPKSERSARLRKLTGHSLGALMASPSAGLANLAILLPGDGRASLFDSKFKQYRAGGILKSDDFAAPPRIREEMLDDIRTEFSKPNWAGVRMAEGRPRIRVQDPQNGPVRVFEQIEWVIMPPGSTPAAVPKYNVEGVLVLESVPGPVSRDRDPAWRVAEFRLQRGAVGVADPDGQLN
jgi:hypothetical protein